MKTVVKAGIIVSKLDKEYNFSYDGELLHLVPKHMEEVRSYDFLVNNLVEQEILEGQTTSGENIFFLKCELKRSNSEYIAKPAGYVVFDDSKRTFSTLTLYGEAINFFYTPNQIYDEDRSSYEIENLDNEIGMTIQLRPFKDVTRKIEMELAGLKANATLSITIPPEPRDMRKNYSLGSPCSLLRFEFELEVPVESFIEIYSWITNYFCFLNFQRDITFSEIRLGTCNSSKKIVGTGSVYLIHSHEMELGNVGQTIGFYFIENQMRELMNVINSEDLNLLFIPKDIRDKKYVDPQKYITCCTSFESVFNYVFPDAKANDNRPFNKAKKELYEFFDQKDEEYKGVEGQGAVRKQLKSLRRIVEYADYSLDEKYRYCERKYAGIVKGYKKIVFERLKISEELKDNIPGDFRELRNLFTHSSLSKIENTHIAAFSMARCYIYIMILEKTGVSDNMVRQCIERLF